MWYHEKLLQKTNKQKLAVFVILVIKSYNEFFDVRKNVILCSIENSLPDCLLGYYPALSMPWVYPLK